MKRSISIISGGRECWVCSKCQKVLPPEDYYKDSRRPNGLKSQCKACHVEGATRTRDIDLKREANTRSMAKARQLYPAKFLERERIASRKRPKNDRVKARAIINLAVRSGQITKPSSCEKCGVVRRITAHHSDYSKPLDVQWLCYPCHGKEHRRA